MALGSKRKTVETAQQCAKDRKVHLKKIECDAAILAWFLCSFGSPSRALVVYHLERGGMPFHGAFWVETQVPSIHISRRKYLVYGLRVNVG